MQGGVFKVFDHKTGEFLAAKLYFSNDPEIIFMVKIIILLIFKISNKGEKRSQNSFQTHPLKHHRLQRILRRPEFGLFCGCFRVFRVNHLESLSSQHQNKFR